MITVLVDLSRSTDAERAFFFALDGVGTAMDAMSQLRPWAWREGAVRLEVLNAVVDVDNLENPHGP